MFHLKYLMFRMNYLMFHMNNWLMHFLVRSGKNGGFRPFSTFC